MVGEDDFMTAGFVDAGLKLVESPGLYLILVSFTSSSVAPLSLFSRPLGAFSLFLLSLSPRDEDPAAADAPWGFGWIRLTSLASRRPPGWDETLGFGLSLLQCSLYVPTGVTHSCFVLVLVRG